MRKRISIVRCSVSSLATSSNLPSTCKALILWRSSSNCSFNCVRCCAPSRRAARMASSAAAICASICSRLTGRAPVSPAALISQIMSPTRTCCPSATNKVSLPVAGVCTTDSSRTTNPCPVHCSSTTPRCASTVRNRYGSVQSPTRPTKNQIRIATPQTMSMPRTSGPCRRSNTRRKLLGFSIRP